MHKPVCMYICMYAWHACMCTNIHESVLFVYECTYICIYVGMGVGRHA